MTGVSHLSASGKVRPLWQPVGGTYSVTMPKPKNTKQCACPLQPQDLTRWVVRPVVRRLLQHHRVCNDLGKRILKQVQETNESVEIIARQIARWSRRWD